MVCLSFGMSACPRSVGWSICDSVNWSVGRCVRCFGMYIGWLVGGRSVGRSVGRPAGRLAVLTPALLFVARLRRATRHSSHFFLFPFFTRLNTYVCVLRHRFRQESQRALSLKTLREEEEAEVHYTRCVGGVLSLGLLVDFLAWFADCFLFAWFARSLTGFCLFCVCDNQTRCARSRRGWKAVYSSCFGCRCRRAAFFVLAKVWV